MDIDADGKISTEAKDPWKEQYLGAYLAPDADGTVKDRGAIVMYSKGSNLKLGTTAVTENGVVNVTIESGKATEGSDDYSMVGGNVTPSTPGGSDLEQGESGSTEYVVQLVVNDTATGSVAFTFDGHSGTSVTLTGTQTVQMTATANAGYRFVGWYVDSELESSDAVYNCSVSGATIFTAVFEVQLAAGLYDANDQLVADWDTLTKSTSEGGYGMDIEKDYTYSTRETDTASPYYVLTNTTTLSSGTNLVIPNSVTSIGYYSFRGCTGLTSLDLGSGVTSIGSCAFTSCSGLTGDLVIPDSVTTIGLYAFAYCSGLTSVDLGRGITSIDSHAFDGCTELTSLVIPDSITSMGSYTFKGCSGLTSITILATTPPTLGTDILSETTTLTAIYVPDESVEDYKTASGWSAYADLIKPLSEKPTE